MASPYGGKKMRVEMINGAEAEGIFLSADANTQLVTFTNGATDHVLLLHHQAMINLAHSVWDVFVCLWS
jgi:hypothetical protein